MIPKSCTRVGSAVGPDGAGVAATVVGTMVGATCCGVDAFVPGCAVGSTVGSVFPVFALFGAGGAAFIPVVKPAQGF